MVTLGAIFMLYILLCCVNGSAQPDETAHWLGQRSGVVGGEKPHRFYGEWYIILSVCTLFYHIYLLYCFICHYFLLQLRQSCYLLWASFYSIFGCCGALSSWNKSNAVFVLCRLTLFFFLNIVMWMLPNFVCILLNYNFIYVLTDVVYFLIILQFFTNCACCLIINIGYRSSNYHSSRSNDRITGICVFDILSLIVNLHDTSSTNYCKIYILYLLINITITTF